MNNKKINKIVVGMSGGVDSSIAALLLVKQNYDVVGLFMKNWDDNLPDNSCPAEQDWKDATRVATKIGIPCFSVDFSKEYWDRVFTYFLNELKAGRTPNPDVLCNKEIKFGPFIEFAKSLGADKIATGHYARVEEKNGKFLLRKAVDLSKDQSYFLNQLSQKQLGWVIFPLGEINKVEVRKLAKENGLVTAEKKDSTGICFIGERNFKNFLKSYLPAKPGDIIDIKSKKIVGKHTQGEESFLFSSGLFASHMNWIPQMPNEKNFECFAKFRYRQEDQAVAVEILDSLHIKVVFKVKQRAITPGQFVVLYDSLGYVLGGGVIDEVIE